MLFLATELYHRERLFFSSCEICERKASLAPSMLMPYLASVAWMRFFASAPLPSHLHSCARQIPKMPNLGRRNPLGFSYVIYATFFVDYLTSEAGFLIGRAGSLWSAVGILSVESGFIWGSRKLLILQEMFQKKTMFQI